MIPGTLQAAQILIALIAKEPADMPDIDRTVAMAAYMSKALDSFMQQPLEQLEVALWPELQATEPADTDQSEVDATAPKAP